MKNIKIILLGMAFILFGIACNQFFDFIIQNSIIDEWLAVVCSLTGIILACFGVFFKEKDEK